MTDLLVAAALTVTVTGAALGLLDPARAAFAAQLEASDLQQRLRVAAAALQRDLAAAGAFVVGARPAVRPHRAGAVNPDPPGTWRPDTITLLTASPGGAPVSTTYYLKVDPAARTFQLMQYDGVDTDLPFVDDVVRLAFSYFADGLAELPAAVLTDGPWLPDAAAPERFDADLLRIRRVRVLLRVQAAVPWLRGPASDLFLQGGTARPSRAVPDQQIVFDVAPRNLNLEP